MLGVVLWRRASATAAAAYGLGVRSLRRRRGSFALRAGLLLFALGSHTALAKLLYAGYGDVHAATPQELRDGALLMYYAGDAVDLFILVAFFGQWYIAGGRRLEHDRRRAAFL